MLYFPKHYQQGINMKKIIIFLGAIILCNSLSGCIFEEERPRERRVEVERPVVERPVIIEHRY